MNFRYKFFKNIQVLNFMKIRPVEVELFYADSRMDRRTDRHDEANGRFGNFSNALKTAWHKMKQINTLHKQIKKFLALNYTVN